jgi:DNA polymerase elongation subunit (family B)
MDPTFRIFDFSVYNEKPSSMEDCGSDDENTNYKDNNIFKIQIFGLNEKGETCSIFVEDFQPFFYVMVSDKWTANDKNDFLEHIKAKMGKYYENSISECIIIKRKKLYGFDGGKEHKFIKFEFTSLPALNKAKNFWYTDYQKGHTLLKDGYKFKDTNTKLYEANIPPLLRFFHIRDISPSGWISLPLKKTTVVDERVKKTTCKYEYIISNKHIKALNDMELRVPYKICSFDIEASSSHGDFPVPKKTYKKLATNIVDYFDELKINLTPEVCNEHLKRIIFAAFGYEKNDSIDIVYPIEGNPSKQALEVMCEKWFTTPVRNFIKTQEFQEATTLESLFSKMKHVDNADEGEEETQYYKKNVKTSIDKKCTVIDLICDKKFPRDVKIEEIDNTLTPKENIKGNIFPKLEGDKVTFIGSTFMNFGDVDPCMNHCIVLNTCAQLPMENTVIETYSSEKEVLLAWQRLIQRENPDIVIGYNIFGFDYMFMFKRAEENECVEDFLKLSRNKDEICGTKIKDEDGRDTGKYKLEESSIQIASGQHDLRFIKMNGRLQVDLYNYYRREANLTSYKLDYVAGNFIGDFVKSVDIDDCLNETEIKTGNMTGLLVGSFVHFEEIGHSVDYYADGAKFVVKSVNKTEGKFKITGQVNPDQNKKVRWCLAKDDVTPKDIFRMTNGSDEDRSVIAKYCIQDCNLVHYLFNKSDILTGFIEMAKICSVPINFLVMRGQGIKLTSYIAKKCREKRTLMPVIEKGGLDEGYEGAIVLDPKCDLYLDNPVACVDYASLYPSSMISENLSHDSKVWTKEYDLAGNLLEETGEKDDVGNFIYDNLPGYEYVNLTYDTYQYVRKTPTSAAEKVRCGQKTCRFAQPLKGEDKAIMPSILEELLVARKTTRKLIPLQTDEFMKQVLDQRQLGYKVTANSLYGQCGAKTSTFYEKDIAACTTATGRMLLTYAKKIIEDCYGDAICNTTSHGPVLTKAEYIYGDSVANYTPIYISTFKKSGSKEEMDRIIEIVTIEELANKYGNNNWVKCLEPGKQEKEVCELEGVETWSDKGWTKLYRVIRHELASHKKMMRILTHTGLVDVTDDHSLILTSGKEISPKDVQIGTELLHNKLPTNEIDSTNISVDEARIMGFFFGDGSCGEYDCPSGKKSSWALNNASMDMNNKYLDLCKKTYPNFDWVIMPTLNSSGVYKISPRSKKYGSIVEFIKTYRNKLYFEKSKIIPNEIINGDENIKKAFFDGLYDADGDKDVNGYKRIDQKNQISASYIALLATSLGFNVSINTRSDKQNIYRITMTRSTQRKNPNSIKKIIDLPDYQGFVYDLTTDNHHFAAGIGNMIVHNTDSVFFTFNLQTPEGKPIRGKEALEITIELAQEAGHLASSLLKKPHDLEYEKTFMPFCLLSKKRYVGMLYETDPNKCKRKEMGIVLKRRDNAPIVKDIYGGIIDILMKEKNIQNAIDFLKGCLQNIVDEKYPIDKLIITKSLRSGYKNPQSIAHKVLADRITARDPGNKPSSGDRIPFVYINTNNKNALQGEKIETPTYILENGLKIDYSFYITNQIMKPTQQLFSLVLEKIWEMQKKRSKILKFRKEVETLRKKTDPEKFEDKLNNMKDKEIKALLFDEYLRETNNEKQGNQSLTKYFKSK